MPKDPNQQLLEEMRRLTPEQMQMLGARIIPLNQTIREENSKTIPDYEVLLQALEGIHALNQDLNLTPGFNIEKVRAEYHLKVTAPKTLQ